MFVDILKNEILQNIGQLKPASKGWQRQNCRMCQMQGYGKDTRGRFGIQFTPLVITTHCFNCGFAAVFDGRKLSNKFKLFLHTINVPDIFIKEFDFALYKQQYKEILSATEDVVVRKTEYEIIELPKNSHTISEWISFNNNDENFSKVVNYAYGRRLDTFDNLYWSPELDNNMNERLILPYYYRGNLVGYTARLYYDAGKKISKYYQQCPTDFVYNLDNQIDERKFCIVTEGVIDAYCVDGVATLGDINQEKINHINRLHKQIIVSPDKDKNGTALVEAALENNWAVSFPKWDKYIKDAAQASETYGKLLTLYSIIQSRVINKTQIDVMWQIELKERYGRTLKRS
jgi:hypothetical protein